MIGVLPDIGRLYCGRISKLVLDGSEQRYLEGAVNYFEVIDAQRLHLNAELSRVQTMNARYAATVDLVRAFGGRFEAAEGKNFVPVQTPKKKQK